MPTKAIDNLIALRVMYLITAPFTKWPAYKDGIIDENGNKISEPTIDTERDWTLLHRLVAKMKKIIAVAPGGRTFLGGLTASYLLVKEEYDPIKLKHEVNMLYKFAPEIMEEIAVTGAASVSGPTNSLYDPNAVKSVDNKYVRRNKQINKDQSGRKVLGVV